MLSENSVLQVGFFTPSMQSAVDQRVKADKIPDGNTVPKSFHYQTILTTGSTPIPRSLIEQLPKLEMIANCGVGYDNLPLAYLKERGIVASNTPGVLNAAVCELTFGMVFALLRKLPQAQSFVLEGRWPSAAFPLTTSLAGKRVGIVGMGRIAQDLAKRLIAFDVHIAYCTPKPKDLPYLYVGPIEAMAEPPDLVIKLCPGGAATAKIANAAVFKALGPQGFFINVARGSVVDEAALIETLKTQGIAGAALDVFNNEPNINPEFLTLNNVLVLPHLGSATTETRHAMIELTLDNLQAHYRHQALKTPIPL
jgi:lactate dehydrogenase-like 2-hydroxyacid dehydrogenase